MTRTATERRLQALADRLNIAPRAPSGRRCTVERVAISDGNGGVKLVYALEDATFQYTFCRLGSSGREAEETLRRMAAER